MEELRSVIDDPGIEIEQIMAFTPASSSVDTEVYEAIETVAREHFPGAAIVPSVAAGFTDSHFFRDLGMAPRTATVRSSFRSKTWRVSTATTSAYRSRTFDAARGSCARSWSGWSTGRKPSCRRFGGARTRGGARSCTAVSACGPCQPIELSPTPPDSVSVAAGSSR